MMSEVAFEEGECYVTTTIFVAWHIAGHHVTRINKKNKKEPLYNEIMNFSILSVLPLGYKILAFPSKAYLKSDNHGT